MSKLFQNKFTDGQFIYHPKCKKLGITHLMFVDDLLFFTKGDLDSIKTVTKTLLWGNL